MSFVYLDTSVALAQLLAEDRTPPPQLWKERLISSKLLEYETWTRIHSRKLGRSHSDAVRLLLGRISTVEMISTILTRATEPFPGSVRTLDALHLATILFLQEGGQQLSLASYDENMTKVARALKIGIYKL